MKASAFFGVGGWLNCASASLLVLMLGVPGCGGVRLSQEATALRAEPSPASPPHRRYRLEQTNLDRTCSSGPPAPHPPSDDRT